MNQIRQSRWRQLSALEAYDVATLLGRKFYSLVSGFIYRRVFKAFGKGSVLYPPLLLVHPGCISIGRGTMIRDGVRMEIIKGALSADAPDPQITIGDNVNIEQHVHIVCRYRVTIGSNVSITGFCSIVDTNHLVDGLTRSEKVGSLIDLKDAPVEICDGAFIGMGARILPGVRIGRGAVVGANAVVTSDVPDYHIATGVPAIVRRARRLADDPLAFENSEI